VLFRSHKLKTQEEDPVVENMNDGPALSVPPTSRHDQNGLPIAATPQPQPCPEKDVPPEGAIGDVILSTGLDVYHAHFLFADIRRLGFNRALARHRLPPNPTLLVLLVGRGVIKDAGPDAPEWVTR